MENRWIFRSWNANGEHRSSVWTTMEGAIAARELAVQTRFALQGKRIVRVPFVGVTSVTRMTAGKATRDSEV